MKAATVLVFILLVITASAAAASARKLAGDDGQQTGKMVTQTEVNVLNGKQSDGYGEHQCSMKKFPACKQGP
ncbi:hypothetical protein CFC21_021100 [Triticum aestivum]|uniref:Uncharacterized protein n=2 Tax=Triticum aestivum TaxID=4565 RepID=A0A3B6BYB3_WHEAT|nr:hypothetical protein CFC21_021100 [Triticum aestivum]